jgi:hypothetical protein
MRQMPGFNELRQQRRMSWIATRGRGVTPRSRPEAWSRAVPPGAQPHERAKPTVLASEDGEELPAAPAMLPAANGTVRSVGVAMRGGMAPYREFRFRRFCQ